MLSEGGVAGDGPSLMREPSSPRMSKSSGMPFEAGEFEVAVAVSAVWRLAD